MNKFSYSAAYLDLHSQELFKSLGIDKNLHMTTCFDQNATISEMDTINFEKETANIKKITIWDTPNGKYLIAELSNCDWSQKINEYYKSLGAVEDLPHKAHITLLKSEDNELLERLQSLVGKEITFTEHKVKVKGLANKPKF